MIHQLLYPSTNRRLFTLFRHPALLEAHKLQVVALEVKLWRFMSSTATATVCEISDNVSSKRKMVSKNERKALVEAYVNQYREMNDGKFPTPSNVKKHVGGSYYKVRAILQEYEYSCKSAVATAAKNSTIGQIAQVNEIFDDETAPNCQLSNDRLTVVENCGISPQVDSSSELAVDKICHGNMVDDSASNTHHERTNGLVSGYERDAGLELREESEKTFDDRDVSNKTSILEIQEVPVTSSSVKAMDDPEFRAKPGHHTEVTGTSGNQEAGEIDESADQAFECDEFPRCEATNIREVSNVLSDEKQVGAIHYDGGAIVQDSDNSMVGDEMKITTNTEKILDHEVSVARVATMDDGHASTDNDSSSQMEADDYCRRKVIDESILIGNKEVTAYDACKNEISADLKLKTEHQVTSRTDVNGSNYNESSVNKEISQQSSLVMDTSAVSLKGITENCVVSAKASLPSEVPSTSQNSGIDESVASAQAFKSVGIPRGTATEQTGDEQVQESSLWGNVKMLASNIINFWRKS